MWERYRSRMEGAEGFKIYKDAKLPNLGPGRRFALVPAPPTCEGGSRRKKWIVKMCSRLLESSSSIL